MFELIICTCDRYGDLWEGHMALLEENWGDRNARTILVTDKPTDAAFPGVEILAAGEGAEFTQRLALALERVQSKYILFTLDDYFLTRPIDSAALEGDIRFMEAEQVDYLRLYPASRHQMKVEGAWTVQDFPGYYVRNMARGDYKISLYPGIWRVDFMKKTLELPRNAWEYEVAVSELAKELGAKCAISCHREFPILDVVRKGKLLPKARWYFHRHPIYHGGRETLPCWDAWRIELRTMLRHWLPGPVFQASKRWLARRGHRFYSPVEGACHEDSVH